MAMVRAYDKNTGRKHTVPERWIGHPVLGRNLRKTPLSEKQQRDADRTVKTVQTSAAPVPVTTDGD